jgi:alkanesulfonate monooxygenase SsuD/methylene tetrahydromethanopterin reductase-like flavin-dependent oxidoreductase (luciferase family)
MPNYSFPGEPDERLFDRVVELARAAEAVGFDLVTMMDHFYQIPWWDPRTHRCSAKDTAAGRPACRHFALVWLTGGLEAQDGGAGAPL